MPSPTENKIKDLDLIETIYYKRSAFKDPWACVCILTDGQNYSRGMSILSRKDNFNKKVGRAIAQGRAIQAWVNRVEKGIPIVRTFHNWTLIDFDPVLTDDEQKLVESNIKSRNKKVVCPNAINCNGVYSSKGKEIEGKVCEHWLAHKKMFYCFPDLINSCDKCHDACVSAKGGV